MKSPLPHIVAVGVIVMSDTVPVYFNDAIVGQVQLEKQGMYYRIYCRCEHVSDGEYTLVCAHDNQTIPLGTYVTTNIMVTRALIKNVVGGRFQLLDKDNNESQLRYFNKTESVYEILQNLPNLRLVINQEGRAGVLIIHPEQD